MYGSRRTRTGLLYNYASYVSAKLAKLGTFGRMSMKAALPTSGPEQLQSTSANLSFACDVQLSNTVKDYTSKRPS